MHKLFILATCLLVLWKRDGKAQNISGIINNYAAVTGISGVNIAVGSASAFASGDRVLLIQMKGAVVTSSNNSFFGDIVSMGSSGTYEFLDVLTAFGNTVVITVPPTNTYNIATGVVQLVRVPRYCMPNVTTSLTCAAWNPTAGIGGILAFEAGTLTLNGNIDVSAMGFWGGSFASSGFCCNNGNFAGPAGGSGGQKGEGASAYISGLDGLKGKQANAGGGGNCGNSGGGGGGNGGTGGLGGNQYSGCTLDDRGRGGLGISTGLSTMFMGGGGGGGFRDNGQTCTPGGNGGGIIYIKANTIVANSHTISSCGGSVTIITNDEGAGGGGAGGTIFIECMNISGTLKVKTDGGSGGSNYNSIFPTGCHGPGGGGGGGVFAYSPASLPANVTASSLGGPAGTVNNPLSTCYNTTYGAAPGNAGISIASLPATTQAFNTPTLSITQSNTICSGQTTTLSATGATTYSWSTNSTASAIAVSPPANAQYTLIGYSNTCSASIVYSLPVTQGPTITAINNGSICSGQIAMLTVSGASTYSWSNGSVNDTIFVTPNASIVYTVTGTTAGCSSTVPDSVVVVSTPTVIISGPGTICYGQTAILSVPSASTYSWSTGATSATVAVSPLSNTTYSVTGANSTCSVTNFHSINVTPVPTLNVTGTPSICTGASATLNASGATSYVWSTGAVFPTVTVAPPSPGTTFYTVTGTSNSCNASYIYTLSVVSTPTVTITGPFSLCSGHTVTLSASFAANYLWSTGATTSTIAVAPQVSTSYSVVGANSTCTASASQPVNVIPSPTVMASASSPSICSGGTTQLIASGAPSYYWNTTATSTIITITPPVSQVYTVTGTLGSCTAAASVSISVTPTPTLTSQNYSLCIGVTQATLVAGGASSYVWSPANWLSSGTGSLVIANPPHSITYTLQGFNGVCTASALISIQAFSVPLVSIASSTDFVCKGYPVILTASGADAYQWQPAGAVGNNTLSSVLFVPGATAVYTVYGYTSSQCAGVATKTIVVVATPELYVSGQSYAVCTGGTAELQVSGADSYQWDPPLWLSSVTQSVVTVMPLSSQAYTIMGTNGSPPYTCSSQVSVAVSVMPFATLNITAPDSICYGEPVHLSAKGAGSYTWSPPTFLNNAFVPNPVITPTNSVLYTITGEASGSCTATQTLAIAIKPLPFAYAGRDTSINFDQSLVLNGQGDGWLYTWKSYDLTGLQCINCPVTNLQPKTSMCYTLEVQNSHGCIARDQVCVDVTNDYAVYIPNSFTPSNDGLNDRFMPLGFGVLEYELMIYDRWDLELFYGKGSFTGGNYISWDGTYKGIKCKSDTYVYKFVYTIQGHKILSKEGQVLLLSVEN